MQDRSQRTLENLLNAAEQLLQHKPFDLISVQEIATAAGSSVGAFYARFPSKDALLHSLHERYVAESLLTAAQALDTEQWREVPLAAITRSICAFLARYQRQHAGLKRAFLLGVARDALFQERARALAATVIDGMARLLEDHRAEMTHPDPRRAAEFVHRVVFSVLDQDTTFGSDSPAGRAMSSDELVDELARACLGYLCLPG